MNDAIRDAVAATRSRFVEDLLRRRFKVVSLDFFKGPVEWGAEGNEKSIEVEIEVGSAFPFVPPRIRPINFEPKASWHLDADGGMCLWDRSEANSDLPWANVSRLLARASEWLHESDMGWPNDEPDLDLERYLTSDPGMFLYEDDLVATVLGEAIVTRTRYVNE